jgi:hypothetical protein
MKKKNVLIILLVLSAVAIWSNNAYRIFIGLQQAGDDGDLPAASDGRDSQNERSDFQSRAAAFVYQAKHRDPFENWLEHKPNEVKQPVVARRVEKIEPLPPTLRLSGIVRDHADVLAIIETPEGQVFFAHPQDTIAGVKLVRIDSSSVTCEFAKRKFQIELR